MKETAHIVQLLHNNLKGKLTPEGLAELDRWADGHPQNRKLLEELSDKDALQRELKAYGTVYGHSEKEITDRMLNRIKTGIGAHHLRRRRKWRWAAAAAALLLAGITGGYFLENHT